MEPRKHLSCTVERATGITNALSLSLLHEQKFVRWHGRRLARSIDRSILRVHKPWRKSNSYAPTQARAIIIDAFIHTCAYNGAIVRTRLRRRVNTRNGALLLRVIVLIDGIFEAGAKIRGDSRSVPPRRGVEAEGGRRWQRWGRQTGKADVCSEIIHRP